MKKRTSAPKQREAAAETTGVARHAYWAVPFVLFLITRLFSADPYYLLGGDQCTYLELGRTFPKHQLFDHELYLLHPPLFGYAIGVARLVMPLLAAGLVTTLLFACLNFFAVRELAVFDRLPRAAIFVGLTYLALSRPGVAYDYHVARVSMLVATTALALLAFLRWLRAPDGKALAWAIAANVVCLLVSDQAILLLPAEAILLWARGRGVDRMKVAMLAAASVVAAAVWPAVRFVEFTRRADLPAGIDGMIEFTQDFPLLAVVQPNFLPFTNAHRSLFTQTSLSPGNLDLGLLPRLPADLVLIPQEIAGAPAGPVGGGSDRAGGLAAAGAHVDGAERPVSAAGRNGNERVVRDGVSGPVHSARDGGRGGVSGVRTGIGEGGDDRAFGGVRGGGGGLARGRRVRVAQPAGAARRASLPVCAAGVDAGVGRGPLLRLDAAGHRHYGAARSVARDRVPHRQACRGAAVRSAAPRPAAREYRISYIVVSNEYLQRYNNPAAAAIPAAT